MLKNQKEETFGSLLSVVESSVLCNVPLPMVHLKANISRGGKGEAYDVDDEMEMLSIQVAKALDLDIAGVDLLFHSDGYRICEANSAPGFEGFEEALDINVPQKVFDYVKLRCGGY